MFNIFLQRPTPPLIPALDDEVPSSLGNQALEVVKLQSLFLFHCLNLKRRTPPAARQVLAVPSGYFKYGGIGSYAWNFLGVGSNDC